MKPHEAIAVEFATALVEGRWDDAYQLLTFELQQEYSPDRLRESLEEMFSAYAAGPAKRIFFDLQFSMQEWPGRRVRDVGWAYVSVEGDDFLEGVTLVVAQQEARLAIRDVEWGRP